MAMRPIFTRKINEVTPNEVTEEISNIYYKGFSEADIEQLENYLHRILKNVEDVL